MNVLLSYMKMFLCGAWLLLLLGCGSNEALVTVQTETQTSSSGTTTDPVTVTLSVDKEAIFEDAAPSFEQVIDGDTAGDVFGVMSISGDGQLLAVGAPEYAGGIGFLRLFEKDGTSWVQIGTDVTGDSVFDLFGASIDISDDGTVIAVGALGSDSNGTDSGLVEVYTWNGTTLVQRGPDIPGGGAGHNAGVSVALSADGDVLAVGSSGANNDRGEVNVYDWNETGSSWDLRDQTIDGDADRNMYGYDVALSDDGTILAIGIPSAFTSTDPGRVRVFSWDETSWSQLGQTLDGDANQDTFGMSIALSDDGSRLIVGAPFWPFVKVPAVSAYARVYSLLGSTWTPLGLDIEAESLSDGTGVGVAMSGDGDTILVGSSLGGDSDEGLFRQYTLESGVWTQRGETIYGDENNDFFGWSVDMSSDGITTYGAGALYSDNFRGHVHIVSTDSASASLTVTARLSQVVLGDVVVALDSIGVATGGGVDYTVSSSNIVITTGQLQSSVTMSGVPDMVTEGSESVILFISSVNGGIAGDEAQVTIRIDDN